MNPVAEFKNTLSISRRTPNIFNTEQPTITDSSQTLRRRSIDFVDYLEPEDKDIVRVPWSRTSNWRDIGTSRVRASEAVGNLLEPFYDLRESEETLDFITKNSFLLQWLLPLYFEIRGHFPGSKLYLEVVSDPELDDVRLVSFVKVDCDPREAIERLDKFDRDWAGIVPKRVDQRLTITLEF